MNLLQEELTSIRNSFTDNSISNNSSSSTISNSNENSSEKLKMMKEIEIRHQNEIKRMNAAFQQKLEEKEKQISELKKEFENQLLSLTKKQN